MISDHIQDLITVAKSLPNGIHRNKIVSHLEDALAHARVMALNETIIKMANDGADSLGMPRPCSCPDGAINSLCPIHGENIPRPV